MSIHLYCPPTDGQNSADLICRQLPAIRMGRTGAARPTSGDRIICWGFTYLVPDLRRLDGIKVLNRKVKAAEKYDQALILRDAGIPTIQVSRSSRPNWHGRRNYHEDGHDFTDQPTQPDYYVKHEEIVEEYRLHSFLGRSIRFGKKVHREDDMAPRRPHPWIRSWHTGWTFRHGPYSSTAEMRDISHRAVKALDLDFGAVDLGKRADGSLIVLEVNRAPGLWGFPETAAVYLEQFRKWAAGR